MRAQGLGPKSSSTLEGMRGAVPPDAQASVSFRPSTAAILKRGDGVSRLTSDFARSQGDNIRTKHTPSSRKRSREGVQQARQVVRHSLIESS